jgi:hypothetical protein
VDFLTDVVCRQVIGMVNDMRQRAVIDEAGDPKHILVTDSELLRIDSLSRYIQDANGGRGMVCVAFAVSFSPLVIFLFCCVSTGLPLVWISFVCKSLEKCYPADRHNLHVFDCECERYVSHVEQTSTSDTHDGGVNSLHWLFLSKHHSTAACIVATVS